MIEKRCFEEKNDKFRKSRHPQENLKLIERFGSPQFEKWDSEKIWLSESKRGEGSHTIIVGSPDITSSE